MMSDDVI